jgi:hypothetical protein
MSREEEIALKDAQHVTDIANAMLRARAFDPIRTAIGLAIIATVIAGENQLAKTVLAITMKNMSAELDPDLEQMSKVLQ